MEWDKRSAYVFIKTAHGKAEEIWRKFQEWDHAIGAWIVTGEWDVVVWFDASSWDDVYKWTSEIRAWDGVRYTSSHLVYHGYKNDKWWWQKPVGTWIALRAPSISGAFETIKKWDWVVSAASIPGDWDYFTWLEGENWDEVWDNVMTLASQDWETITQVPVKSWWNRDWAEKWWPE